MPAAEPQSPADVLARDLADVARHAPGRISVAVRDARGLVAEVDADRVVPAASLVKVLVLAALLDECAERRVDLQEVVALPAERVGGAGALCHLRSVAALSLDELARLMIALSDNDAANILVTRLGPDRVEGVGRRIGMVHTQVRRAFMDEQARAQGYENTTCAADMALLLATLRDGGLLPFREMRYAFELLGGQQHTVGVTALLPDGVVHASKPGDLRGMRHDAAVIETGSGAWASVAVLATGLEDTRYGQDYSASVLPGFNAIGEAVHAYLQA